MAEKRLDLGNGLEVWEVESSEVREQDTNARSMDTKMFDRLSTTIKRDKRLESLPLMAVTDAGVEIVSGHHRVRAAVAAGMTKFFALVDTTGLSSSQIKAKQLAHNSIQGKDDAQIVATIYQDIQDAEARLEAFIDRKVEIDVPKVKIGDVDLNLDYRQVMIIFLPHEKEKFERIAKKLGDVVTIYASEVERFEQFRLIATRLSKEYEIISMGTILSKMADIVAISLGEEMGDDERVSMRDLFKAAYIPKEAAEVIRGALEKMKKAGDIGDKNLWQALELWAADYSAGE
jgi:hypothetical protein